MSGGFAGRNAKAIQWEQKLIAVFRAKGWTAYPFGQSLLPPEARELLRHYVNDAHQPTLLRWMPDIIAFRCPEVCGDHPAQLGTHPGRVVLIDAKTCEDRPNYAVEMSAQEAAAAWTDRLHTPTFFVFDDGGVLTPRDVAQRGRPGPAPSPGRGSGTPYFLVEKRFGVPFRDVFPAVTKGVSA